MNAEEYRIQVNDRMVLDYTTLNVTLKEVAFKKETSLAAALEGILRQNKIEKPSDHNSQTESGTNYYTIDLTPEQVEQVIDILFALEADHVDENGEATPTSSFYASIVDKWTALR